MSAKTIDPSKVKVGDRVTVKAVDTKSPFVMTGIVEKAEDATPEDGASAAHLTIWGRVYTIGRMLVVTDHHPAEPEWKPGTVGTATVRGVEGVTVMRTDAKGRGPWFTPTYVDGFGAHPESEVTGFVPDDTEALRADLAKALRERDEAMADAARLRDLFGKAKKDARTIVGGGTGIRFDGVQIIEAEIFVQLMQERSQALADKDTWITRHNQEVVNAKRVQDEMAEGIKKIAVQRDEARTEAQAAREVSVSERERAEEFSRQVEEERWCVDGLRKTIDSLHLKVSAFEREHVIDMSRVKKARQERDKALVDAKAANRSHDEMIAKFHLIRCENDKLRTKLEEARKAALPTDLTKCVCHPHTQDAGAGFTEYLLEYEPACPLHSKHVYDPRQGMWVESAARTMPTREQVHIILAFQYDNYFDDAIGRSREDFLDDATGCIVALFEQGGAASPSDFKKDNS